MAHKKTAGSTTQHTTRPGKRLGVKRFGGEAVTTGMIIIRQRGSRWHAGAGAAVGRDFTLYAIRDGKVNFSRRQGKAVVRVVPA